MVSYSYIYKLQATENCDNTDEEMRVNPHLGGRHLGAGTSGGGGARGGAGGGARLGGGGLFVHQ